MLRPTSIGLNSFEDSKDYDGDEVVGRSGGSNEDGYKERREDKLKWPQRMTISMGIARGLHFLLTGIAPGVFENGLKLENILYSLTLKISNYKIPLPIKESSSQNSSPLENSEKDDIYKLGVIMLDLVTGRRATSENQVNES